MSISKIVTPYEFLVRWTDGKISGAHVKFLECLIENGKTLSAIEGIAQPVSMAGEIGFPIEDIFAVIQSASVATAQAANVAIIDALGRTDTANAAIAQAEEAEANASEAAARAEAANKRLIEALSMQTKLSPA